MIDVLLGEQDQYVPNTTSLSVSTKKLIELQNHSRQGGWDELLGQEVEISDLIIQLPAGLHFREVLLDVTTSVLSLCWYLAATCSLHNLVQS